MSNLNVKSKVAFFNSMADASHGYTNQPNSPSPVSTTTTTSSSSSPSSTTTTTLSSSTITTSNTNMKEIRKRKVSIVGAGNWGTAVASKLGNKFQQAEENQNDFSYIYDENIILWVYDELIDNKSLVDIINESHENTKYLKGIKLTPNIIATNDIYKAINDIDIIIIAVPHEFLLQTLFKMKECGGCKQTAVVVSLTKGLTVTETGPKLLSDIIKDELKINSVAVLMGANVAGDVSRGI